MLLPRAALPTVRERLALFPAVALIGPRQAGKTTLAHQLLDELGGGHYLDLERPSHRDRLAHPETYLGLHQDELVVLDEVQAVPHLFPVLRSLIDEHRRPGRFLLLGSASPALLQHSSETLAGRLDMVELTPLGRTELPEETAWREHWWRGGFPPALLAADDASSRAWLSSFVRTYVERELPAQGVRVSPELLGRSLTMLAYRHGQVWNGQQLAASLGITGRTVANHRDHLIHAFLVRELRPFHANLGKRLVKKPKVYLRDSGILHTVLRVPDRDALLGHPLLGASFEGYVVEQVCSQLPQGLEASFWSVHSGAELDLVLHDGVRPVAGIEVKYGDQKRPARGFYSAVSDLSIPRAWVVHSGEERWRLDERSEVIGLDELLSEIHEL